MRTRYLLTVGIIALGIGAAATLCREGSAEERHLEVAMYAQNVGMTTSFHMIFDFRDTNRLGLPPLRWFSGPAQVHL